MQRSKVATSSAVTPRVPGGHAPRPARSARVDARRAQQPAHARLPGACSRASGVPGGAPATSARMASSPSAPPRAPRAAPTAESRAAARPTRPRARTEGSPRPCRRCPPAARAPRRSSGSRAARRARDRDRRGRGVRRAHDQVRPLVRQRQRHRARPVPTSCTRAPAGSASADLHQQLGLRPGDQHARIDPQLEPPEALDARGCTPPARAPRRRRTRSPISRAAAPGTASDGSITSAERSTPSASAISSSASSRGVSTPAAVESVDRGVHRVARGHTGRDFELPSLVLGLERRGELVELAAQDAREVALGEPDAVVGHPVLREVVGADLLRARARADLRQPLRRLLGLLRRQLALEQPRAQHAHRPVAVLELRLLVLHRDDHAGRLVRDAHGRVGRVDRLPARARGAVDVDLQVVRVDLHVHLLGLGQHRDRRGRGVDAALRLGLGHPLHPVRAALVLEHAVRALALHGERVVAVADLERLLLEPAPLGVAGQHPVEVGGEQPGLLPARARPDLDDHVLVVVRVGLDHRQPDLLLQLAQPLLGGCAAARAARGRRRPRRSARARPRRRRSRGAIPGRAGARAPARGRRARPRRSDAGRRSPRVRHLLRELGEAALDLLHEPLDHADKGTTPAAGGRSTARRPQRARSAKSSRRSK